jgi:hypothetical protein
MTDHDDTDASVLIDATISGLGDWRGERLTQLRALILEADPDIVEEVKWRKPTNPDGVPTWTCDGIVCTGETYKDKVKLTFAHGASLPDPEGLFNSSLGGKVRRAIDVHEADQLNAEAFKDLVQAAVDHNRS